jgi:epoxyqueuosine reductase QueG
MGDDFMDDKKQWLTSLVVDFLENDPVNRMGEQFGEEKMWDKPLVKFASGSDPIFRQYKSPDICSEEHWLPEEIFAKFYAEEDFSAEELTLISWILPQTRTTKDSMYKETDFPSERWARARIVGEPINDQVRLHMVNTLQAAGYQACAPVLHPEWTRLEGVKRVFSSKWSERHIAYAAGHGTFGLCDALITPVGKALRTGSVIIRLKLPPDERPYKSHLEYCLYYSKGACGLCVQKCPAGAISLEKGHDKLKCSAYLHGKTPPYIKKHFGLDGYGCGFCQIGVPCENGIPS